MKNLLPLLLLASTSGAALADTPAMLRCRVIAEAPARLACYDAIALPGIGSRAGWGAPLPGAAPAPAPGTPVAPGSPIQQFGLEDRGSPAGSVDAIESRLPGTFEGWNPKSQFRLANGQVWAIVENSTTFYKLVEPRVKIRRGVLGAFYMDIEGVAQSARVRRIQ